MDRAGVALFDEVWQVACVVNVRVAQDHGVHLSRIMLKRKIAAGGFVAMSLKQAAFQQKPLAVNFNQVLGARGGARRAEEVDFHFGKREVSNVKLQSRFMGTAKGKILRDILPAPAKKPTFSKTKNKWTFAVDWLNSTHRL